MLSSVGVKLFGLLLVNFRDMNRLLSILNLILIPGDKSRLNRAFAASIAYGGLLFLTGLLLLLIARAMDTQNSQEVIELIMTVMLIAVDLGVLIVIMLSIRFLAAKQRRTDRYLTAKVIIIFGILPLGTFYLITQFVEFVPIEIILPFVSRSKI